MNTEKSSKIQDFFSENRKKTAPENGKPYVDGLINLLSSTVSHTEIFSAYSLCTTFLGHCGILENFSHFDQSIG